MKKLIILNYNTGDVIIIDAPESGDYDDFRAAVDAWCQHNQMSINNCDWMAFDGNIRDESNIPASASLK